MRSCRIPFAPSGLPLSAAAAAVWAGLLGCQLRKLLILAAVLLRHCAGAWGGVSWQLSGVKLPCELLGSQSGPGAKFWGQRRG